MMLFNRKVNCWFCQHEQRVSFLRTNSWTCESCKQYNGFTRDGDYNKSISEMHASPVQSKISSSQQNRRTLNNENILCDRCNRYQELKMLELNKFEPKDENNEEEEFRVYKLRIEEIYDLCISCKKNVQSHLHQIDKAIGTQVSASLANRRTLPKTIGNVTNAVLNGFYKEYQYDDLKSKNKENLVKTKAHTVAGTIGPYQMKNLIKKKSSLKSPKNIKKAESQVQTAIDPNIKTKIHYLIACEFCIFLAILSIFMGDIVNVLNDSQSLQMDINSNLFLIIHQYSFFILSIIIALSIVLFMQRPKIARIINILLISGCTWVHNDSYESNNAEKRYIIQLLSSFFLSFFIFIARLYNIIQAISYFKTKPQLQKQEETLETSAVASPSPKVTRTRARKNSNLSNVTPQRPLNTTYNLRSASTTTTPQNHAKTNDTTCSPMQVDETSFNDFKVPTTLLRTSAY